MPVRVSYPGVYIQEVPSGVRTITGVSTSIAAFVGMVQRGKLRTPTRVLSFPDYVRQFGSDTTISEMTDQVRQFFLNGGQEAWIVRIAQEGTATAASVDLLEETGSNVVLTVTAKEVGSNGNSIRVEIDYDTPHPDRTFNLRVFRVVVVAGVQQIEVDETFTNLSMNPNNGRFVETIVNQQSVLVNVQVTAPPPALGEGFSLSGLIFTLGSELVELQGLTTLSTNSLQISVDGSLFVPVTLPVGAAFTSLTDLQDAINLALNPFGEFVQVSFVPAGLIGGQYLEIRSVESDLITGTLGGSVEVLPAASNDITSVLQMGVAQGGIEMDGYARQRPAPSVFFSRIGSAGTIDALSQFADSNGTGMWTLTDASGGGSPNFTGTPIFPNTPMFTGTAYDVAANPGAGSLRNVRENLQILADSINANTEDASGQSYWNTSLQGLRLVLRPLFGNVNSDITATLTSAGSYNLNGAGNFFDATGVTTANVASYSLGPSGGTGAYQNTGASGQPGGTPTPDDYRNAFYEDIDRDVDLFNLMILPRAQGQTDADREAIWGLASSFCLNRRAFLLVDPRSSWTNVNTVDSEIADIRIGLVKDHAAIYWPRVQIPDPLTGILRTIDPAGSIAGLMARIDSNRGVWKAPAGLEADIRGIRALEHSMSDPENGIINPEAVNALRVFPNGIVSWGARTMDGFDNSGNDDYKYIPVRRIALFIEESLFRGLKFAVFEPNDEPLWAQIRLAAGAFMNNLFRQGAFQGQKARDAYFVKVDSETTTQNDINLGIVNVIVGFAPLKPAEFVVITIQQIAGQVQT